MWPRAPGRGTSSMRRTPAALRVARAAGQVVDLEADVVQAGAAPVQELLQAGVAGGGDQLDGLGRGRLSRQAGVQKDHVGLLIGDVFPRPLLQGKDLLQAVRESIAILDGDGDVIDALDLDHGNVVWRAFAEGGSGLGPEKGPQLISAPRPFESGMRRARTYDEAMPDSTGAWGRGLPRREPPPALTCERVWRCR